MAKVLVRRLGGAIPVLLVLALVVFILRQIAPIDQVASVVGENASPEVYAQARQDLGLNDPLPQQYLRYVSHTARGDLGRSTLSQRPISKDLGTALAAALEAPKGAPVDPGPIGAAGSAGPRLQDLLDASAPFEVTVHDDFGFWLEGVEAGGAARVGLEQANQAILPTVRLEGLGAAY